MSTSSRVKGAVLGLIAVAVAFPGAAFAADDAAKSGDPNAAKPASAPSTVARQDELSISARRPTGSLWTPGARSVVEDYRARQVGDLLTIVVQESATATSTANTKSSKSDSANFGGGTGVLSRFLKDFGATSSGSSSGQGQTSRTGSLATRLTVVVKEILANGNMVIEGTRVVTINKETQKITLTGTVRQQDVSPDNSVSSIQVANAAIQFDGKGTVGDRQKKGIIGRIFDFIF
jgi:flagellar L-ring protein FlgH